MDIKPTMGTKPTTDLGKKYEKTFDGAMTRSNIHLNEIDSMLNEENYNLKRKIFDLSKMEALIFSDPKLTAEYDKMAEKGSEMFGYHYNETIVNMLFNDYVLNSPKYLQKYKMAIPKKSKRRDKSGINQLRKAGQIKNKKASTVKTPTLTEQDDDVTKVKFLVNETDPDFANEVYAYFPDVIEHGNARMGYAHMGQHTAISPYYAEESRDATPEEYADLKSELEGLGYNLEVVNGTNESTGAAGAGAYAPALDYKVEETTSASSSGAYVGPAAWGNGDLMKGGKSPAMRKPIWQGGTIIQESNYLTDSSGFENYINALNEQIDIENPEQSQKPNTTPYDNNKINNDIIDKTAAFSSNTVKQWNKPDTELEYHTMTNKTFDEPDLKTEAAMGGNRITTLEELKAHVAKLRAEGRKGVNKEEIPMLAGDALYKIAVGIANRILSPMSWDELPDTNSMWSYIRKDGGMTYEQLMKSVKKGCNDRLKEEGMSLKDLGYMEESVEETQSLNELSLHDTVEYVSDMNGEDPFMLNGIKWQFVKAKYPDGKMDIGVYRFGHDLVYDYSKWKADMNINENSLNENIDADENIEYFLSFNNDDIYWKWINEEISTQDSLQMVSEMDGIEYDENVDYKNKYSSNEEYNSNNVKNNNMTNETEQSMIGDNESSMALKVQPTGTVSNGGVPTGFNLQENMDILNEINDELNAYSIHQNKLMKMSEDRRPSSLVLKDRLGSENATNFKKDLQHSGTKEIINVEKELMWKDQQTEVGKDPMKLGEDIENTEIKATDAKGKEHLKNVGDSANYKGDEIPKRNLTTEEQHMVDMYRLGQQDLVYDNKPSQAFEERMKKDMGDDLYKQRQEKLEFRAKAPMYAKDTQPVDKPAQKTQFEVNKFNSGISESSETMISGRYKNILNKSHIIDFNLNEVKILTTPDGTARQTGLFELDFTGLGNSYNGKTVNNKVSVNESVVDVLAKNLFYTDGKEVYSVTKPTQKLNENDNKNKTVINEEMKKMKHLLGYEPKSFVSTSKTKNNRGF